MGWVWESLRPGITVAPSRSMTRVPGPFDCMTSAVVPTWENVPCRIATASANGRLPSMVANRPLCRIKSAVLVADDVMASLLTSAQAIPAPPAPPLAARTLADQTPGYSCPTPTATAYSGKCVAGASCTMVYAYSTPMP